MPYISNDFLRLYVEVSGEGQPVLFLHGYTGTVALWETQVSFVSPDYRVICLDQRGHGRSNGTDQAGYTLEAMASDVLAVLDSQQVEQITVALIYILRVLRKPNLMA